MIHDRTQSDSLASSFATSCSGFGAGSVAELAAPDGLVVWTAEA